MSDAVQELANKIGRCRRCLLGYRRINAVPGEGLLGAQVMVIGEAPGKQENIEGRPFVGRSGQFMREVLDKVGLSGKVFIANVVKCRPEKNGVDRPPSEEEVALCQSWLREQIKIHKPKVILALGATSANMFIKNGGGITAMRGKVEQVGRISVIPTFHPSYMIRRGGWSAPEINDYVSDFKKAVSLCR